jgi:hypothetical protein
MDTVHSKITVKQMWEFCLVLSYWNCESLQSLRKGHRGQQCSGYKRVSLWKRHGIPRAQPRWFVWTGVHPDQCGSRGFGSNVLFSRFRQLGRRNLARNSKVTVQFNYPHIGFTACHKAWTLYSHNSTWRHCIHSKSVTMLWSLVLSWEPQGN